MKTSKIIMSTLAGLLAVSSVHAQTIEEACNADPELYWIADTQECLPIHPCQDDELKNDEKYCNRVFANVQTPDEEVAEKFVKAYISNNWNVAVNSVRLDRVNYVGQDYVLVSLTDGRRIEFEFDDARNHAMRNPYINGGTYASKPTVRETMQLIKVACNLIYHKTFDKGDSVNDGYCRDMNEAQYQGLRSIFVRYSVPEISMSYDSDRKDVSIWVHDPEPRYDD